MAVKLSDLTTESSPASTDIIGIADPTTGIMRKITVQALKTYMDSLGGGGDVTAPTITARVVANSTPTQINLTFSESVTATTAGFSAKKNGSAWSISSISGSGTAWTLTMGSAAAGGDTLLLSYDSATGATVDGSANELASFTDAAVTNNVAGALPHTSPFTAANGTLLDAYTPSAGNAWVDDVGEHEIQSNRATAKTVVSNNAYAMTDVGQTTYTITTIVARPVTADKIAYVFFRYTNIDNCMFIQIADNDVKLYKIVATVATLIGTFNPSPSINDTSDHTVVLTVGASTVSCTIDGNSVFTGQAIDGALTGTKVGLGCTGSGVAPGDVTFDSFNVVA